jgi:assimilatory nitrate reductase catalytic subunit
MYATTETARRADLVLPAAGWGEKEGTLINSERRIGLVKKIARAPGQALADFHIFKLIAQYWGCVEMFARWSSPEAVFQLMKEFSRGQPCDMTGIEDYRMIDACGGVQWPWAEKDEAGRMQDEAGRMKDEPAPAPSSSSFILHPSPFILSGAAAVFGRALFSSGRPGEVSLRHSAPDAGTGGCGIPAAAAHRSRHIVAVAHEHAHRKIRRPAQTLSGGALHRDQPARRRAPRHRVA